MPYPTISNDPLVVDQPTPTAPVPVNAPLTITGGDDQSAGPAPAPQGPTQPAAPAFVPLEPTNPDSASSSALINAYNDYIRRGGRDEDLSYDQLHSVISVAKGKTNVVDKMTVLQSPELYRHQVYDAGKSPLMVEDVVQQALEHPDTIPGLIGQAIDWTGAQAQHLIDAGIHGIADTVMDNVTQVNPWASQQDRDMAGARLVNGILRGGKGGITMVPQLVQGAGEMFQYSALKSKLASITDPAERDKVEGQISETLRLGELRQAQNDESINNAHKDLEGLLNFTGLAAALKGTGLPDRLKMLSDPKAQPTPGEQMILGLVSDPTNLLTLGAGEVAGVVKSAVRFRDFDEAVGALNTVEKQVTNLQTQRAATTAAIASATDDTVKASLKADLSRIAAQEKEVGAIHANALQKVTDLGGAVTDQMNKLAPTFTNKIGIMGTGAISATADGAANLVENVAKVPGHLAERVVGSGATPEAKAWMTDTISDMAKEGINYLGFHAAAAFGPIGYAAVKGIQSLVKMIANPEAMRTIARDARVVGDQLALGKQTLPALQEIAAKTSGLNSALASMMDNPTVRAIPSMLKGGASGAATGALLGGVQTGGAAAGFGQGGMQGGVFGAAGGGHGQLKSYNSPVELRNAAIGDRARFVQTLNPDHRPLFNKLRPDTQLAISVFAHAHPDMKVAFVDNPKGPNGSHYVTDEGGHVTLNVSADNPLEAVLTHEIAHHIVEHGLQDAVNDHILGNPATGHIGLFTALDENGKPTITSTTDPVTGTIRESYMPDQRFFKYQGEYNARKLRDVPGSNPEGNYGIAQEIFAELTSHQFTNRETMQKLIRGTVPSDLVNTSAITNFFSKLGLPFDAATGNLAAHPDTIRNIQGLNDIVSEYIKGRQFKNHPLEHEDGYSRVTPDMWRTNPDILYRNLDGSGVLARDPKTGEVIKGADGLPIIRGDKAVDADHAKFTQSVIDLIRANPSYQSPDVKAGWVLMKDRNGREVYRTQNVPADMLAQMSALNEHNPFQIANWAKINGLTMRDDGSMMLANYNKATGRGGKYVTVGMKERAMVPLYSEASPKTNQVNIQAYDPGQMMKNVTAMLRRKAAGGLWGNAADALADVHTYLENLASGKPGETTIGLAKKQVINAMFGINTQGNPFIEQIQARIPSVFKTFRIDRANKVREVVGVIRPVYGQTYEQVRSFMQPRKAAAQGITTIPSEHPEAIPVTTRPGKDGKPEPIPIPYDITKSPLIADKYPVKVGKDSPDRMSNQFWYINPTEGKRLTALDDASAVTTFANELLPMLKEWMKDPEIAKGKEWYDTIGDKIRGAFGKGADKFMQFLAATSPMKRPHANFLEAYEAHTLWEQGHYDNHIDLYNKARDMQKADPQGFLQHVQELTGSKDLPASQAKAMSAYIIKHGILPLKANKQKYGFNSEAVLKVLADRWSPEGPKTPQFNKNITGEHDGATIDDWAARTLREIGYKGQEGYDQWRIQPASKQGVSNEDFAFGQLVFARAAEKLGWKPKEAQALAWVGEQDKWVKNGWADIPSQSYDKPADLAFPKGSKERLSVEQLREALKEE